jgi:hypothetical protein
MPWMPEAENKRISVNFNKGGNSPKLLIVHIMEGSLAGTDSWFHNPQSQVSAHFGVGKDGTIYQWVGTNNIAWHAMEANNHSIGVEHEGFSGNKLTDQQVHSTGKILRWAHGEHPDISLWLNTRPFQGSGLSYHALGGDAWGGHLQCPGSPIVAQLDDILAVAKR